MPSFRKVKSQLCCSGSHAAILLVPCSSKCTQQPFVKNAGAITPAEAESVNATKLSCCFLPLAAAVATPATWAFFPWIGTPKGRAADAADTESFSYTRTKKKPPLPVCLSRGAVTSPSLIARDLTLTSFTTGSVSSWPHSSSALHALHYLPLKWSKKNDYPPPSEFQLCGSHKQRSLSLSVTVGVFNSASLFTLG